MIAVKGYAAKKAKAPLGPFEFERREVGKNDVLIDIKYCGICHSDIHQARDEWGGSIFPMVPGHEIVGKVAAVGESVKGFKAGDTAGVGCFVDSCRKCASCREGLQQYCENEIALTYNGTELDGETPTFGGYSTKIVVNQDYVLRVPDSIPMEKAAPLLCAGITLYSPLRHWRARRGMKVGVMGLGGLGHMGVQIAAAMGCEVTIFSSSERKRGDAKKLGAARYVAGLGESDRDKLAGSQDLIISTISAPIDLTPYLGLLKRDGTMVLVGVPDKPTPLGAMPLILKRRRLAGSLIGGIAETQEMLDFCGKHGLGSWVEVIPIKKVNEAYAKIVAGEVRYRFVIDIGSIKAGR